ncbi:MAG: chemotaxis protein CheA [Pseudomonadota bacterium]
MTDPMAQVRAGFFEECRELLEALEAGLLSVQEGAEDDDTVDAIFRSVHTIKGGAGAFGLAPLTAFAHHVETVLDAVRSGGLPLDPDLVATLLRASDHLTDLIEMARTGDEGARDFADLVPYLRALNAEEAPPGLVVVAEEHCGSEEAPAASADAVRPRKDDGRGRWTLEFRPRADLLGNGNEPAFLFRALGVLGDLDVHLHDEALPDLHALDAEASYLGWTLHLHPSAADLTKTEILSIFEFVEDLCDLSIRREAADPDRDRHPGAAHIRPSGTGPRGDEIEGPAPRSPSPSDTSRLPPAAKTIRVELDRVDGLIDLVGELVISQSMLARSVAPADYLGSSDMTTTLEELAQLTRDIQESVMAIRAQPIRSLFQRMTRVVREAAQATGKAVRLEVEGEDTEIDKAVVERLADPLMHMIRNAIGHGLEEAGDRVAASKDPTGVIRLRAFQRNDRVVIEVSDDGRGIDRELVRARAVEKGLLEPDARLAGPEIDRLIFRPGFSTTDRVSSLSGRGVGMDVVSRAIHDLDGTISVASTDGAGCTFSASLPLTLAILDGMIVRVSGQRMVVPLSAVIETQLLDMAALRVLRPDRSVVMLHGEALPLVHLGAAMGFGAAAADDRHGAVVFVRSGEDDAYAVQVDEVESQGQVVIKGITDALGQVPCVSAATILNDGRVALIVDTMDLARTAGLGRTSDRPEPMEAVI